MYMYTYMYMYMYMHMYMHMYMYILLKHLDWTRSSDLVGKFITVESWGSVPGYKGYHADSRRQVSIQVYGQHKSHTLPLAIYNANFTD